MPDRSSTSLFLVETLLYEQRWWRRGEQPRHYQAQSEVALRLSKPVLDCAPKSECLRAVPAETRPKCSSNERATLCGVASTFARPMLRRLHPE